MAIPPDTGVDIAKVPVSQRIMVLAKVPLPV